MLYGSCTVGIYNDDAVFCVFTQDYPLWRRREIEEFLVVQWTYRALCAAVSILAIEIRLRFDKKKDSERPKTARTTCKACICPAVCNIQFI